MLKNAVFNKTIFSLAESKGFKITLGINGLTVLYPKECYYKIEEVESDEQYKKFIADVLSLDINK